MSGTYMTVTSLMGYGGGPLLVGWISQAHGNLGLALAGVLAVTTGLVIVGLIFALRPVSEAARLLDAKDEGIPAWASQDAVRDIAT